MLKGGLKAGPKEAAESRKKADMGLLGQTLCQFGKSLLDQWLAALENP
jgi:hypothetical protein